MPCHLSVNLNAIAMLRNRRNLPWPSVVGMGRIALQAGAHGLTVHPRPDERHIRRTDVPELAALIATEFPDREFNIEGNPDARFVELVEAVKPAQVTLVPDDIRQSTSDHGWNIGAHRVFLKAIIARLKDVRHAGVAVHRRRAGRGRTLRRRSAPTASRSSPAPMAAPSIPATRRPSSKRWWRPATRRKAAGIGLNAGHDLTLRNLPPLAAALPHLAEVSIGHAITADALIFGMAEAVRRYRAACGNPVAA